MADPYGISGTDTGQGGLGQIRPPRWSDWDRQRRRQWRSANPISPINADPTAAATPVPPMPGGPPSTGSYYNPDFNYGASGGIMGTPLEGTALGSVFFNDPRNFGTAYDVSTRGAGIDPATAFGRYVSAQANFVERALNAARTQNPNLDTMAFLRNYVGDLRSRFQMLPSLLRGETPRLWGQGETRVILR